MNYGLSRRARCELDGDVKGGSEGAIVRQARRVHLEFAFLDQSADMTIMAAWRWRTFGFIEKRSMVRPGSMRSSRSDIGIGAETGEALEVGVRAGTVTVGLRWGLWLKLVAADPAELRGSSVRLLKGELLQSDRPAPEHKHPL